MHSPVYSFPVSLEEAKRIQEEFRDRVDLSDAIVNIDEITLIGGADVSFITSSHLSGTRAGIQKSVRALAGIVIIDIKDNRIVETVCATVPVTLPYIPGYLSFREGPALCAAFEKLTRLPDVMVYDGCGIAHPRGLGLASHMALLTGIPSIGCAKSILCGTCDEPGMNRGDWSPLVYKNRRVGTCLRTRDRVKPVYVSPGSGFSIETATEVILGLARKYRLPEPTRRAHNLVTVEKKSFSHTGVSLD